MGQAMVSAGRYIDHKLHRVLIEKAAVGEYRWFAWNESYTYDLKRQM